MATTTTPRPTIHCTRCGRTLTDPTSIARGVGPTCARRIAANAPRLLARHTPAQIDKAIELIGDGGIARTGRIAFLTVSSDGTTRYETTPLACSCKAGQHGRDCYHKIAAQLIAA